MNFLKNYKILLNKEIIFKDYKLTSIKIDHIQKIRNWRNQQIKNLRQEKKIKKNEQIKYFKKNIFPEYSKIRPKNILLSLYNQNKLIGYGGLVHINWNHRRSEISLVLKTDLEKSSKKKIIFNNFIKMIKMISFDQLRLNKIYTETYSFRKKEIKILSKNGFKIEGKLKEHIKFKSKYYDSIIQSNFLGKK